MLSQVYRRYIQRLIYVIEINGDHVYEDEINRARKKNILVRVHDSVKEPNVSIPRIRN